MIGKRSRCGVIRQKSGELHCDFRLMGFVKISVCGHTQCPRRHAVIDFGSIISMIFYLEKYTVRKKMATTNVPNRAKTSEDHHSWLPLVININVVQKHKKNTKRKVHTQVHPCNNDVPCNRSTSARLSKFQFTGY